MVGPAAQHIDEGFEGPELDSRLRWYNPPLRAELSGSRLVVASAAGTDFWQRTHYGFRADNGHFLFAAWAGDFVLATTVRFRPVQQYDQAGLMVRLSPDCWLKTSVEFEPDRPSRLGAVVTNQGWSDWSTQDVPKDLVAIALRVRREGADYVIEQAAADAFDSPAWSQLRVAHLAEDDGSGTVRCGLYACSPKGAGFVAEFEHLSIRTGRVG
jgi:regulation of enolase protein 1 (concanavalin A-like superfamily)